ncbi:hypothetical protein F5Y13DRAFT_64483 [Hypoxylon sp. FL1857]|nr:hypothetical protein F5Y13DRAFT_64483 [Hypoxylon sp. FL1857]
MERPVKNRRFHRKSRRGCLECKRRHIKCDERRPSCGNCDVAARACSYADQLTSLEAQLPTTRSPIDSDLTSPNASVSPSATGTSLASSDCDEMFTLQHLGLLHHIESGKADWLMVTQPMEFIVQACMTLALSTPYLMNQLLALSAQHLRIVCQDQTDMYHDLATQLQTRALRIFNKAEEDMSEESVIARFLFSSLVGVQVLAQRLSASRDDFDEYMDGVVDCMKLQRGAQIIGESSWEIIRESTLSDWIASIEEFEKLDDDVLPGGLHDLHTLLLSSEMDKESIEACVGAVQALGFLHRRLDAPNTWGIHAPMNWAILISGDYIHLLGDRRPEALVILAHWAVYLHRCRSFWAFGDAGEHLIRGICEKLGDDWKEWLLVPLEAIPDT